MWFGDITTMAWWDNLYLKEGFATVMGESIILDRLFPEWHPDSQFLNDHLNQHVDAIPGFINAAGSSLPQKSRTDICPDTLLNTRLSLDHLGPWGALDYLLTAHNLVGLYRQRSDNARVLYRPDAAARVSHTRQM